MSCGLYALSTRTTLKHLTCSSVYAVLNTGLLIEEGFRPLSKCEIRWEVFRTYLVRKYLLIRVTFYADLKSAFLVDADSVPAFHVRSYIFQLIGHTIKFK